MSIPLSKQCLMVGWLMNDKFKGIYNEAVMAKLRLYPSICLDSQTKATRNFRQDSQCHGWDSNTAHVNVSHKHYHLNKLVWYFKQMSILYPYRIIMDERTHTFRKRWMSYRTISKSVSASQLGNIFTTFQRHFITSSVNRWDGVELPAVSYRSLIRAL